MLDLLHLQLLTFITLLLEFLSDYLFLLDMISQAEFSEGLSYLVDLPLVELELEFRSRKISEFESMAYFVARSSILSVSRSTSLQKAFSFLRSSVIGFFIFDPGV